MQLPDTDLDDLPVDRIENLLADERYFKMRLAEVRRQLRAELDDARAAGVDFRDLEAWTGEPARKLHERTTHHRDTMRQLRNRK